MTSEGLNYSVEDGIATIEIDRPHRMNAMTLGMKPALAELFGSTMRADRSLRVVLITAAGERAFCAGADIKERAGYTPPATEYFFEQKATHDLFRSIEEFEHPVIAAVNGIAFGAGMELALSADIRIAAETASFGLPEVNLGVIPGAGGTQRLPRVIGMSAAKEMIFTGRRMTAQEALERGLVSRVVPQANLRTAALGLAREIAEKPPLAISYAKHCMNAGSEAGADLAMQFERYASAMVFDSEDRHEGMRAFLEKRKPVFAGR